MKKSIFTNRIDGVRVYAPRIVPVRLLSDMRGMRSIVFDRIAHVRYINDRIRYMKFGHEHRYRLKLAIYNPRNGPVFIYKM